MTRETTRPSGVQLLELALAILNSDRAQIFQHQYRPALAFISLAAAWGLFFAIFPILQSIGPTSFIEGLIITTVLALAVTGLSIQGRRWKQRPLVEEITKRQLPPILYLRAFSMDEFRPPVPDLSPNFVYHNEDLLKRLNAIGPVLSVGNPQRKRPALGQRSVWVREGEDWRSLVTDLMACAQLTIVEAGVTAGARWELVEARRRLNPQQLLVVFPLTLGKENRAVLCHLIALSLQCDPLDVAKASNRVMRFDDDWKPHPLNAERDWHPVYDYLDRYLPTQPR